VVKLLGDGILLRFDALIDAVEACLTLLDDIVVASLGHGHAGLAAGPIVERDGDVFGSVVNLASRVASVARSGELLTPAKIAGPLSGIYSIEPFGPAELKGFPEPVDLVRVGRWTPSRTEVG
jgi:adenylate cyclase